MSDKNRLTWKDRSEQMEMARMRKWDQVHPVITSSALSLRREVELDVKFIPESLGGSAEDFMW